MMGTEWRIAKTIWQQITGEPRNEWSKISDDEWEHIAGDRARLIELAQLHYGWKRVNAEHYVDEWHERHRRSWGERSRTV